jgi:hypothetical protein
MRTKTLLCLAALTAAGVTASMAQSSNVYSLNIVGYANVGVPSGAVTALANPFDLDGVNSADKILNHAPLSDAGGQPGMDQFYVQTWNGLSFDQVYFEQDFTANNTGGAVTNGWATGNDGATQATPPNLPPGTGFFINNGGPSVTNVFVGNVVGNNASDVVGTTNTSVTFFSGSVQFVGSPLALSGSVNPPGSGFSTLPSGPLHLPVAALADGGGNPGLDQFYVQTWNGLSFDQVYYEQDFTSANTGGAVTNGWATGNDGATQAAIPVLSYAQGFFINNGGPTTVWAQSVTNAP